MSLPVMEHTQGNRLHLWRLMIPHQPTMVTPMMPTLLDNIRDLAASSLRDTGSLPLNASLPQYHRYLRLVNERLRMYQHSHDTGREVCFARSYSLDLLVQYAWAHILRIQNLPPNPPNYIAILATGGYGRNEVCPKSDVDILFLHDPKLAKKDPNASKYLDALMNPGGLYYLLMDLSLRLPNPLRTIDEQIQLANQDIQTKTSLIDLRFITGHQPLFETFERTFLQKCIRGQEEAYLKARVAEQTERRAKFGNSHSLAEPNIKQCCGGLRDFQNLLWMIFVKYRVKSLESLRINHLLTETEEKRLTQCYDFLLRVRNELHLHVPRASDVLTKALQPRIALDLGFSQDNPRDRIEAFLGQLYQHLRNTFYLTRNLEQRLALAPVSHPFSISFREVIRSRRLFSRKSRVDGFYFLDGSICSDEPEVFNANPRRLIRVFLLAQQQSMALHPDLENLLRNSLHLVGRKYRNDSHIAKTFLEILSNKGNVAPILRTMHETGFLGKYMPEFGKLTCHVQHEFLHQFTTDEHTLVCIEKLDQTWGNNDASWQYYSAMFEEIEKPYLLYLALLLHDVGKADDPAKHSSIGSQISAKVAKRLRLPAPDTERLAFIIQHHLLMTTISQRSDLDDPSVIEDFAHKVQSPETLRVLTLHSRADTMGTSEDLWNGFKDSLLRTLYQRSLNILLTGQSWFDAEKEEMARILNETIQILPKSFSEEEITAHFNLLIPRYFRTHSPREIAADLARAHRFMHLQINEEDQALNPVITWHNETDRGYTTVHICTWDRAGLFCKIAGALAASGLNILSAQIFTRQDGIIFDTFYVVDDQTGALPQKRERALFEQYLEEILTGKPIDLENLILNHPSPNRYRTLENETLPTTVTIDPVSSADYTIIDIESEDKIGLLYTISKAIAEVGLTIALAKISSGRGVAVDTFYIQDILCHKLPDHYDYSGLKQILTQRINDLTLGVGLR